ncbi:MAG: hypothetical protein MUP30_09705 [Deltaproteobacteria bacterium]|nr:hypothetical protein [Deltaproteobacteria bacterium]
MRAVFEECKLPLDKEIAPYNQKRDKQCNLRLSQKSKGHSTIGQSVKDPSSSLAIKTLKEEKNGRCGKKGQRSIYIGPAGEPEKHYSGCQDQSGIESCLLVKEPLAQQKGKYQGENGE